MHAHTHTYTHTHTLSLSLSLSLSHTQTHTHTHTNTHTHTHDTRLCLGLGIIAFCCSHTHTHNPYKPTRKHTHTHTHTNRLSVFAFPSARCLLLADMLERWPHVCRVKITLTTLPTNCFASTRTNPIKCLVNWILLRILKIPNHTWRRLQDYFYSSCSDFIRPKLTWKVHHDTTWGSSAYTLVSGKSFWFSELFLGILLAKFCFTVFFPGAVE